MRVFTALAWLALIVGIVLQLWLKDRHVSWAVLFYGMPKPCLIALAFVLAVGSHRVRWLQKIAFAAMISLTLWWTMTSYAVGKNKISPTSTSKDDVTLLYWNLCRPNGLDQEAIELVMKHRPHIAGLRSTTPWLQSRVDAAWHSLVIPRAITLSRAWQA
jgi:hypothetical protein